MSAIPATWLPLWFELNGRPLDGTPGVRDIDAPCEAFQPAGAPFEYASGVVGGCETDGHYICSECVEIDLRVLRRRRDQCEDCGAPLAPRAGISECCSAGCDLPSESA